jgi:hypothetical protein
VPAKQCQAAINVKLFMSKQSNKVEKRKRRDSYLTRKKDNAKAKKSAKKAA